MFKLSLLKSISKKLFNQSRGQGLLVVTLSALSALSALPAVAEQTEPALQLQARAAAMSLGVALKSQLQQAVAEGGLTHAVEFCHLNAQALTRQQASDLGIKVTRTSLKVRNPANAPDAWQQSVLETFARQQQQGIEISAMEHGELLTRGGDSVYRFMKAIPTQALCLGCHGDAIAPEVAARIQQGYPNDQATGFQPGDIRGAFFVEMDLSRDSK